MVFRHQVDEGVDAVLCVDESERVVLRATIARKGAELIGLTRTAAGQEPMAILWRNELVTPPKDGFWARHAPILFPIVGGLHDNQSRTVTGERIHFPGAHGFLRNMTLPLTAVADLGDGLSLTYLLQSDPATLEMYPWRFTVTVTYAVRCDNIEQSITVANEDTRPMPYQLGWHPGFRVPWAGGRKGDCRFALPQGPVFRMLNDENCYLTGERVPFDTVGDFRFTEEELQRTYMFDVSMVQPALRFVELRDCAGRSGLRFSFPDYPHLGIWSDAHAPFLCIEPWQGMDDSVIPEPFDQKFGMVLLAPGASQTRTASIRLFG